MENSHFVGVPSQTLFSTPPPPPHTKGNPSTSRSSSAKVGASSKRKKDVIHVDDDVAPERTKHRLTYTPEEEKRLVMKWLGLMFKSWYYAFKFLNVRHTNFLVPNVGKCLVGAFK